ncbi:ankyrin repeat protein, putative [Trichomonas vaginalis G3]|uniref:Ankyrin repeat protein, putative n=1 Tax=Trichomonas vaginalis (strain ATCC PRA-98 / G3) TaxID=412133 RepID=A2FK61_TRIV3|nr:protein ubiquitination [Trichomonas vaginalis G3]EAX94701.1 ankyrin repeat protein, putative [Trichomonas vaginalis G3]KAI5504131.1 protein ubiquitination [Trichomonas vaginalis G3]|eukprot:XP_001307631.1 ankyrin repeat protein [Trichomonas vaginalis G3]
MSSIDYGTYAKDFSNWYNNEDFYELRTVSDLCKIFDLCKFSTNQFIQAFTIISKKFSSTEVATISQHVYLQSFVSKESAFEALDFISKITNNESINGILNYLKSNTVKNGKNKKYLLQCDISPDSFDKIYNILSNACEEGDYETIKFAFKNGYSKVSTNEDGEYEYFDSTLLFAAHQRNDFELVKQLSIFSDICTRNSLEAVKCKYSHLDVGVTPDKMYCKSPLHYAALNVNVEVVKYICSIKKININLQDMLGSTPLHYGALNRNVDVIKFLCSLKGINKSVVDYQKKTPLHYAVLINNVEVVKYLCSLPEIDINAEDNDGFTALHYAVENDNVEIIDILSKKK